MTTATPQKLSQNEDAPSRGANLTVEIAEDLKERLRRVAFELRISFRTVVEPAVEQAVLAHEEKVRVMLRDKQSTNPKV